MSISMGWISAILAPMCWRSLKIALLASDLVMFTGLNLDLSTIIRLFFRLANRCSSMLSLLELLEVSRCLCEDFFRRSGFDFL